MKPEERKAEDPFFEEEDVASASECTGLMPALPQTEAEDEASAALYAIHRGKAAGRMFRTK